MTANRVIERHACDSSDNLMRDLTDDPPTALPHTFPMSQDQYQKGLSAIRSFLDGALRDRGIVAQSVQLAEQSPQREASLSVSANGKTQAAVFSYAEVEDSGEAIDAPTAAKIRRLVSHFFQDNS
ncbi:MAG TPA: hypothetical protein VHU43_03920 [Steroidobacteraceae bacterium]|nr:hypothetical protein [Steroidobacteraceae bacterium]